MDEETQLNQARHLEQLALGELEVANRQLAEAGRTIDELRSDALALATRVDQARTEAESFEEKLHGEHEKLQREHVETRALRQRVAEMETEQESLRSTIDQLQNHVARLKKQLTRPERLMAKKLLRRGPFSTRDAS